MNGKGDGLSEIIAGLLMGVDAFALYLLLPYVRYRFLFALWTAFLHMVLPYFGYYIGDILFVLFNHLAQILSTLLLFGIGLQVLMSKEEEKKIKINPIILAFSVSLDTFSVSVSFGMLNLNKYLFIISAGIGAFIFSYLSLLLSRKALRFRTAIVNKFVGAIIISISIWSYLQIQ